MVKEFALIRKEPVMFSSFVLNLFLYFPEDKSEYIPAAIWMAIFFILTILTFRLIKKVSKKEELKTKAIEEEIRQRNRGTE
jgi:flagellar biosynthesis/type III secretory pathway M-ring protein FliF/YscJ